MVTTPSIQSPHIHWLTDETTPNLYTPSDYVKAQVPMDEEMGGGFLELVNLCHEMVLIHGIHKFTVNATDQMIPLAEVYGELQEPMLVIQSARHGRVLVNEQHVDQKLFIGHEDVLFKYIDRLDYIPMLDGNQSIETFILRINLSTLNFLLGEKVTQSLLNGLGLRKINTAKVLHMPLHTLASLFTTISHYQGDLRKILAQSKAIEYLSELVVHVTGGDEMVRHHQRHEKIKELHEVLINMEGKTPTLDELAREYGFSVKTLHEDFKIAYGKPLLTYITEHRLEQAHHALRDSDVPMKQIADRLGYSHVNNFINAFKRKFGYAPGSLRK